MNDVDVISQLYVFRTVPRAEIESLVALTPPQDYPADAVIFRQGDRADVALLVVEGRLEATVEGGGTVRRVGEIGAGEVVGEQALFHPSARRNATVSALQPSRCLIISRELLENAADNQALVALETYLMGSLARRIRSTNRTLLHAWKESTPKGAAGQVASLGSQGSNLLANLRRLFGGE